MSQKTAAESAPLIGKRTSFENSQSVKPPMGTEHAFASGAA